MVLRTGSRPSFLEYKLVKYWNTQCWTVPCFKILSSYCIFIISTYIFLISWWLNRAFVKYWVYMYIPKFLCITNIMWLQKAFSVQWPFYIVILIRIIKLVDKKFKKKNVFQSRTNKQKNPVTNYLHYLWKAHKCLPP